MHNDSGQDEGIRKTSMPMLILPMRVSRGKNVGVVRLHKGRWLGAWTSGAKQRL